VLFCFSMQSMLTTTWAEFVQFYTARIIASIFLCCICSLFAIITCQGNDRANAFFSRHIFSQLRSCYRSSFSISQ